MGDEGLNSDVSQTKNIPNKLDRVYRCEKVVYEATNLGTFGLIYSWMSNCTPMREERKQILMYPKQTLGTVSSTSDLT